MVNPSLEVTQQAYKRQQERKAEAKKYRIARILGTIAESTGEKRAFWQELLEEEVTT